MQNEAVIKITKLYKKFTASLKRSLAYGTVDTIRDFFGIKTNRSRLRKGEFWALEDINLELYKGETLGILGVNGSGKSTLLRLISGIYPPDAGEIIVNGDVGSLIAVGAGFHPYMSGRENIYLNGTILGMSKKQIKQKFDEIVDFAEIADFLDAPVSTYSSGMRVRLGFAIAVHCNPDILLVDEVLSVGDIAFRNKSLRKMREYRDKANAIIFVSHDLEQTRVLCDRVIIMQQGKIIYNGGTHEGVSLYESIARDRREETYTSELEKLASGRIRRAESDDGTIKVHDIKVVDDYGAQVREVSTNAPLNISCEFTVIKEVSSLSFYVSVNRDSSEENVISVVSNENNKTKFTSLNPGKYTITCKIPEHHLVPGVYNPNISFRNDRTFETYKKIYSSIVFKVEPHNQKLERGIINVDEKWELSKHD